MSRAMLFSVKKPCKKCPFINNGQAIELNRGRREEIMEGLLAGQHHSFHCHKTVYAPGANNFDEDGRYTPKDVAVCAGAAAVARKFGRDMQVVQIATRLGTIPYDHYDEAMAMTIEPGDLSINNKRARI